MPGLSLQENYKLAIHGEKLKVADVARRAGVLRQTVYRYLNGQRPSRVTPQLLAVGVVLGFSEKEIRDKIDEQQGLRMYYPKTKREKALKLIGELVQLI